LNTNIPAFHQFLIIVSIFFVQVAKVSDVVTVGQSLSLRCIGQDVRGNIKLSLKATLPQPRSKKDLKTKDPLPSEVSGWTAVENMISVDVDAEASSTEHENGTTEDAPAFSTPSVIIRSAADCDAQDDANGPKKRAKAAKSSPRPYKPASEGHEVRKATAKKSTSATTKKTKKIKIEESGSNGLQTSGSDVPEKTADNTLDLNQSPTNFQSGAMKLGDVVTAKVYQIRAFGLVLELSDGARGMHKFEVISYKLLRKKKAALFVHTAISNTVFIPVLHPFNGHTILVDS
jgi:polyribonucleotide nucleotidyltransferase